jgi:hypothetical protein
VISAPFGRSPAERYNNPSQSTNETLPRLVSVLPSTPSNAPTDRKRRLVYRLRPERSLETALWVLAVAAMLLDVALMNYGLAMGLSEGNPVGRVVLSALGSLGLLLTKLPVLALALAGRRLLPMTERWALPLGLVVPRSTAAVLNPPLTSSGPVITGLPTVLAPFEGARRRFPAHSTAGPRTV